MGNGPGPVCQMTPTSLHKARIRGTVLDCRCSAGGWRGAIIQTLENLGRKNMSILEALGGQRYCTGWAEVLEWVGQVGGWGSVHGGSVERRMWTRSREKWGFGRLARSWRVSPFFCGIMD